MTIWLTIYAAIGAGLAIALLAELHHRVRHDGLPPGVGSVTFSIVSVVVALVVGATWPGIVLLMMATSRGGR